MYHPEEVHLAKQVEYEYQDMANNVDDLKFARPRQENFIKIAFVRVRKSRSLRLSIAAAILLITMLLVILIWLALKQHDGTLIRIQSSQHSSGKHTKNKLWFFLIFFSIVFISAPVFF